MRTCFNILFVLLTFVLSGCYSCQSWNEAWGKGPREDYPAGIAFWDKDCKPIAKAPPLKPAPAPRPAPAPAVKSECGSPSATGHYPCEGCTVVKLEKNMPLEVAVNTKFDYTIKATNPSNQVLSDVVVTEMLPGNFKVADTNPKAQADGGKLMFALGTLDPGQTKSITISGMATNTECVKSCATVTYVIPTCAAVRVVEPALKLTKKAPASVLLCDPIPVQFVVTNTGTGSAGEVKIEDTLPAGLKTVDGKRSLVFNAGTLAAGQSKTFSTTLKADKTGKYENKAVASSSTGLKAEATTVTEVRQPVLAITKTGPDKVYLGRSVEYVVTISNKGDAPAADLVIEDQLPAGVKFVSATDGGIAQAGRVRWNLGTLAAGASRKVSVTVMPDQPATLTNTVTATATCAEGVKASVKTAVEGIPAVLLEVIDVDDPIRVGDNETYIITVTNQGTAPDTNIRIVCTLEDNEQYVSSSGATNGRASASQVVFEPLASLAPKAKATWRVVVKAVKAGDVRFKVTMTTDQLGRPVEETESTHLYE